MKNNILEAIGNTPLVKLNKLAENLKPNIYVKLEFLNPSGSIKDRMAIFMIEDAEKKGLLKPGGTIVENTSGNTGAALAMIAAAKGYKAILTVSDKTSMEKIDALKALGAKVVVCPSDVAADSPESYCETAKRIANETINSFFPNQYNNPGNPEAHYKTTGPEIWKQTKGSLDYLVAGIGTGGTFSGTAKFLKEKDLKIKAVAADPEGSIFYEYFKTGKLIEPRQYKVEGIGQDHLVNAMDFSLVDDIIQVDDKESFLMARRLAKEEGIFAGGSSGSAVSAAIKLAETIDEEKNIVVILPDSGFKYLSKIFNDSWMKENGFL